VASRDRNPEGGQLQLGAYLGSLRPEVVLIAEPSSRGADQPRLEPAEEVADGGPSGGRKRGAIGTIHPEHLQPAQDGGPKGVTIEAERGLFADGVTA